MKEVYTLVNLTGDDIYLQIGEDTENRHCIYADDAAGIPNAGRIAASASFEAQTEGGSPMRYPCVEYRQGYVVGLPYPQQKPGTRYIVSRLVFELNPERQDILTVDTATEIYDDNGSVVAFRRFLKHAPHWETVKSCTPQERIGQNPYALHEFADDYDPSS